MTIFYQDSVTGKQRVRINPKSLSNVNVEAIRRCSSQFGLTVERFEEILLEVGDILSDRVFMRDTLDLNRDINGISMEN